MAIRPGRGLTFTTLIFLHFKAPPMLRRRLSATSLSATFFAFARANGTAND